MYTSCWHNREILRNLALCSPMICWKSWFLCVHVLESFRELQSHTRNTQCDAKLVPSSIECFHRSAFKNKICKQFQSFKEFLQDLNFHNPVLCFKWLLFCLSGTARTILHPLICGYIWSPCPELLQLSPPVMLLQGWLGLSYNKTHVHRWSSPSPRWYSRPVGW